MANIEKSNLSLNSRDYTAIYQELVDTIPSLTKSWDTVEDTDPGIVLVKLMSMLGDMLSYNHDKAVLEMYPDTVTQRKNALQIFSLMGYKMRWYRSAEAKATFSYNGQPMPSQIIIPAFSTFTTEDNMITYTNIQEISVPSNGNFTDDMTLVQGIPRTPPYKTQYPININESVVWHDAFGYNVQENMIINNRIYIANKNIDEKHIILIDDSKYQDQWTLVDNINSITEDGKFFHLTIDEEDNPYIELVGYWNTLGITKFKLFYVTSLGVDGAVSYNTITRIKSPIYTRDKQNSKILTAASNDIVMNNQQSTLGYDPESPEDARSEALKYINTFDTLVTVEDFKKAVMNITGVLNCHATDLVTDIQSTLPTGVVRIYVIRDPGYYPEDTDASTDIDVINRKFATDILKKINMKKAIPVTAECLVDNQTFMDDGIDYGITYYNWKLNAKVYFKTNVSNSEMNAIATTIDTILKQKYDKKLEFNTTPKYLDVIDDIKSADDRIRYVEMDNVKYNVINSDTPNTSYDSTDVNADFVLPVVIGDDDDTYPYMITDSGDYDVMVNLQNTNIVPGSLVLTLNNGDFVVIDNGDFRVMGQTTIQGSIDVTGNLLSSSSLFVNGIINYNDGTLYLNMNRSINQLTNVMCRYKKRAVNLVEYQGISSVIQISNDCMVIS